MTITVTETLHLSKVTLKMDRFGYYDAKWSGAKGAQSVGGCTVGQAYRAMRNDINPAYRADLRSMFRAIEKASDMMDGGIVYPG